MPPPKDVKMDSPEPADLEYDPDQDGDRVRTIRKEYRGIEHERPKNITEINVNRLVEDIERADLLFDQVKGTGEAILDSRILMGVAEAGAAKARAMKSGSGAFDVDEFLSKLLTFLGGQRVDASDGSDDEGEDVVLREDNPLNWEKIGRKALAKSRRVPVADFMLGPLTIEQKQRAAPKRSKFEKNKADETKPQAITEDDITRSENETTKNVAALSKLLSEQDTAINLFRFIINPYDFGQSVENLFYLSFLIRDGKCAMQISDEGEPEIYACEQPTSEEYREGLRKRQLVMELDMPTWRRAIEVFDITQPIIPQRKKAETRIGNKWYG